MPLNVHLRPGERIIIGKVLVTNGDSRARLAIAGRAPILREKDILTPETATTPARRIYLAVQMMYLHEDRPEHRDTYVRLVQDVLAAAPSSLLPLMAIHDAILAGQPYRALKAVKALVAWETRLLAQAGAVSDRSGRREDRSAPAANNSRL